MIKSTKALLLAGLEYHAIVAFRISGNAAQLPLAGGSRMDSMKRRANSFGRIGAVVTMGMMASIGISPASAQVTTSSASATAFDAELNVGGVTELPVFGSAISNVSPPSFSEDDNTQFFFSSNQPLTISGGVTTVSVSGAADPGFATADASSGIEDVNMTLDSVLSLSATDLSTNVAASLTGPIMTNNRIIDLTIKVLGSTITVPATPEANEVVFNSDGVKITLNQEIPDTSETSGATFNAVAIDLTRPELSGDIDIAQSVVSVNATVPEPSTWAMMLAGFAGLGFAGYRASRRTAAAAKAFSLRDLP
jgi:hypothetical protein